MGTFRDLKEVNDLIQSPVTVMSVSLHQMKSIYLPELIAVAKINLLTEPEKATKV